MQMQHFQDRRDRAEVPEDVDVLKERERLATSNDNIKVTGLRKVFKGKEPKVAVRSLTFGSVRGEVFGLLGVNGAGKTTTLSMLTGDLTPSRGQAVLHGHNVATERDEVYKILGYCPQFDALFDLLTGEETLLFYGRIRGIPEPQLQALVNMAIRKMTLEPYRKALVHTYSGGNKRKLSMAVAFMGAPRCVFLDEPSTGMDPSARRAMWETILASRRGRSIILTTHLMEEADALCSRIGIMVNGQLACLGSSQRLKQRFGQGYQVELKTSNPALLPQLQQLVNSIADQSTMLEEHLGHVKYQLVPVSTLMYSCCVPCSSHSH